MSENEGEKRCRGMMWGRLERRNKHMMLVSSTHVKNTLCTLEYVVEYTFAPIPSMGTGLRFGGNPSPLPSLWCGLGWVSISSPFPDLRYGRNCGSEGVPFASRSFFGGPLPYCLFDEDGVGICWDFLPSSASLAEEG